MSSKGKPEVGEPQRGPSRWSPHSLRRWVKHQALNPGGKSESQEQESGKTWATACRAVKSRRRTKEDLEDVWSPENKSYTRDAERSASNLKSGLLLLSAVPSFCQLLTSGVGFGFKFCLVVVSKIAGGDLEISQQVAMFSFEKKRKREQKHERLFV